MADIRSAANLDEPIEAVLQAERQAESDVQAAEARARQTVATARERARAIRGRADARVAQLHAGTSANIERAVTRLNEEESARRARLSRRVDDPEPVRQASERVVDWLLGDDR